MTKITRGNWSFSDPDAEIPVDSIINGGNFSQLQPDTPILVGKALTINSGNWTNVRQDAAWIIQGGNWTQINMCAHLHPELELPAEVEDCPHVISTDEIRIDGELIDTVYHRKDTIL